MTENSFRHSYDVPSAYRLSWLTSLLALWLGIKAVLVARLVFRQLQVTLLRSRRLLRIRGLWSSKGEAKPSQDKEDPHQIALVCSKTTQKMTTAKEFKQVLSPLINLIVGTGSPITPNPIRSTSFDDGYLTLELTGLS